MSRCLLAALLAAGFAAGRPVVPLAPVVPFVPVAWAAEPLAAEPLAGRVDARIEARARADGVPLAGPASDGEFLRRVYLDLVGTIPPVAIARSFLDDPSPDKRAALIDRLLATPESAVRWADWFHVMWMERLGDHPDWAAYLRASFAENKPFDVLCREILRADPRDPAGPGAAFWIAKRLEKYGQNPVDYSGLTRDVGRLFLGKNLQCAECHDHLSIDDYKQQDFQGLHAFFRNSFLADAATLRVGERPTTEKLAFASVFTKVPMTTGPALPGMMMLELPTFPKGMEYTIPPDRKTNEPGVPRFSTRAAAADLITRPTNRDFARNAVNRVWFTLMGRGLVHPLDLHHSGNPASHPELLELLADEFVARRFDLKWLVRELVLTKTYQRSSLVPDGVAVPGPQYFAVALERRLSAEQLLAAMLTATGTDPRTADRLRPKFLKAFANAAREPEEEITPSLKAALFLLHDPDVLGLFKPRDGNLVERVARLGDAAAAEELYLAVLSRRPTAEERATVTQALAKRTAGERTAAVGRVAWALVAGMEFMVNH